MKPLAFVLATVISLVATPLSLASSPTPAEEEKARQVAEVWLRSLAEGQTALTTSLSAVPFSWDSREVVTTVADLERRFAAVVADKGVRQITLRHVLITDDQSDFPKGTIPVNALIAVAWAEADDSEGEPVVLAIVPGDTFKVVGFSD